MSTKIYEGRKLVYPMSAVELLDYAHNLNAKIIEKCVELQSRIFIKDAVELADRLWLFGYERLQQDLEAEHIRIGSPISIAASRMEMKWWESEKTGQRDPRYDLSFEVGLYPMDDGVLVLPFAEQQAYLDILDEHPDMIRYGYWNNTDHPDNISDEEWDKRASDWDWRDNPLGRDSYTPANSMLLVRPNLSIMKYRCFKDGTGPFLERMKGSAPTMQKRREDIILELLWREYMLNYSGKLDEHLTAKSWTSAAKTRNEFSEWSTTSEGKACESALEVYLEESPLAPLDTLVKNVNELPVAIELPVSFWGYEEALKTTKDKSED